MGVWITIVYSMVKILFKADNSLSPVTSNAFLPVNYNSYISNWNGIKPRVVILEVFLCQIWINTKIRMSGFPLLWRIGESWSYQHNCKIIAKLLSVRYASIYYYYYHACLFYSAQIIYIYFSHMVAILLLILILKFTDILKAIPASWYINYKYHPVFGFTMFPRLWGTRYFGGDPP